MLLFNIGFLPVSLWDILDVLIVGYLLFQLYKLLRGSIAFNIFVGVLILYVVYWLVLQLKMDLLAAVLGQFVSVGVIIIIIIFQPEVRRFLLFLGNSTLRQRSNVLDRLLHRNFDNSELRRRQTKAVHSALLKLSKQKNGALLVFVKRANLEGLIHGGVPLEANLSEQLLESIFIKTSPLHDGAVLISNGKISAACVVLPISKNDNLPENAGLRHRAAIGITERAEVAAFIVSEETGNIAFAFDGQLQVDLSDQQLEERIIESF